jgi:hypothetical protein
MKKSIVEDKSYAFAVILVKLYKDVSLAKNE